MKKLPLHGKGAQVRLTSDGKAYNEDQIVEMEYNKKSKNKFFKKIDEVLKKKSKDC